MFPQRRGRLFKKTSFFVYKPIDKSADEYKNRSLEMAHNLKGAKGVDQKLLDSIQSVKINPTTHTLSFSGDEKTFQRIKDLLATIDVAAAGKGGQQLPPSSQFLIYKPVHQTGEQLIASLKEVMAELKSNAINWPDHAPFYAPETVKW